MDHRHLMHADDDLVESWSTSRLQIEPKGWQLQMRSDLRDALSAMVPPPHKVLPATYGAADTGDFVDVENVLLYNVGSRSIRPLMTRPVRRTVRADESVGLATYPPTCLWRKALTRAPKRSL
jgi:hypothetical protein